MHITGARLLLSIRQQALCTTQPVLWPTGSSKLRSCALSSCGAASGDGGGLGRWVPSTAVHVGWAHERTATETAAPPQAERHASPLIMSPRTEYQQSVNLRAAGCRGGGRRAIQTRDASMRRYLVVLGYAPR